MNCPNCQADKVSFWRIWLLNFRQLVRCGECDTDLRIDAPGRIALGTFVLLIGSGAAYVSQGGRGLGLALLLLSIVANFVLTHHYVELHLPDSQDESPED